MEICRLNPKDPRCLSKNLDLPGVGGGGAGFGRRGESRRADGPEGRQQEAGAPPQPIIQGPDPEEPNGEPENLPERPVPPLKRGVPAQKQPKTPGPELEEDGAALTTETGGGGLRTFETRRFAPRFNSEAIERSAIKDEFNSRIWGITGREGARPGLRRFIPEFRGSNLEQTGQAMMPRSAVRASLNAQVDNTVRPYSYVEPMADSLPAPMGGGAGGGFGGDAALGGEIAGAGAEAAGGEEAVAALALL